MLHVSGHTPDLLAVYEPQSQTLIAGDLIYNGTEPFLHDKTKKSFEDWIASLKRIQTLSIKKVLPGHGPLGDREIIEQNIKSLEFQFNDFLQRRGRN